ncbi:hypothetical protein BJ878DRAFT_156621 [Calycina marina]|uniref:Secreted protein n=1 Tax=Calycina marina TaxID=1763456 RepID=A0A9P7Z997_9HELO|nr:hypothetical protein BJ878DRAFT_156621 [Calycina marina]
MVALFILAIVLRSLMSVSANTLLNHKALQACPLANIVLPESGGISCLPIIGHMQAPTLKEPHRRIPKYSSLTAGPIVAQWVTQLPLFSVRLHPVAVGSNKSIADEDLALASIEAWCWRKALKACRCLG